MRCKYCNVLLEEYDKGVCRYCGRDNHVVGSIIESSTHQHIKTQDFITPNDSVTTELVKYYIGDNYEKITKGGFSFGCLFFGWLYLCYRKFWKLLIPVLFITFFLAISPLSFIINIVLAFIFKKEYMKYVNERIIQIRQQNPNASFEELKTLCKNQGGTIKEMKGIFVFISIIILFILIIVVSQILKIGGIESFINEYFTN